MLKGQQTGTWTARVNADTPILAQWFRQLQKVSATAGAIQPCSNPFAVGFKVGGEMPADCMQPFMHRLTDVFEDQFPMIGFVHQYSPNCTMEPTVTGQTIQSISAGDVEIPDQRTV